MVYSKLLFNMASYTSSARKTSNHIFVFAHVTVLLFCYLVKCSCDLLTLTGPLLYDFNSYWSPAAADR